MIVRNNRHPQGIDMGPVRLWRPDLYLIGSGRGLRPGESYKAMNDRIAASRRRRKPRPKPEPVLLHVECAHCRTVFETTNARRAYCSQRCVDRAWKKRHHVPKPRKRPEVFASCEHRDRPMVAHGLCRTCYARHWRATRVPAARAA